MANANFFSPDGGITRYPLEDTEARNRIDNNFQLLRDGEVIEGKNKLEITGSSSYTEGGVRFVVNSDKSVTVDTNGVASSTNARFVLQMPIKHLVNGEEYVISGTPNDIDGTKAYVGISDWDTTNYDDTTGEGAEFTMFNPESYPNARIYIFVKSGTILSNKVFKPMICTLEEWNKSHTYEPYYVPLKDSKFDRSEQAVLGAKNFIPYPYMNTTRTTSGITFTDIGDGSVVINGTATAGVGFYLSANNQCALDAGNYTLLNGDNIPLTTGVIITCEAPIGTNNDITANVPKKNIKLTAKTTVYYRIWVSNGTVVNNQVVKPMLKLASDPSDEFVPYAMTNRELTEKAGVWTTPVSCLTGDTDVTITNSAIHTTSTINPYIQTASGAVVAYSNLVVTEGQAVITFGSALTEAASVKLQILNI